MNPFMLLLFAIVSEVIATSALKSSEGFTRYAPSALVLVGYTVAFYLLSLSIKQMPLGTAYAIWSGLGTVGTVAIGVFLWRESLDMTRVIGVSFILLGVLILNLFANAHSG
jgi:multidrug transporter EmrE-like cation transporter